MNFFYFLVYLIVFCEKLNFGKKMSEKLLKEIGDFLLALADRKGRPLFLSSRDLKQWSEPLISALKQHQILKKATLCFDTQSVPWKSPSQLEKPVSPPLTFHSAPVHW